MKNDPQTTKKKKAPCDRFPLTAKRAVRATHLNQATIMKTLACLCRKQGVNSDNLEQGARNISEHYGIDYDRI